MDLSDMHDEVVCGHPVTAEKKQVFAVYLDLLREFDRLCKQAGIKYWIYFGTLLGAIRHQGFIPWDDDVDILMPRKDFDRLRGMTNEQFGAKDPYFLQNPVTDPTYAIVHTRFRRSDTTSIMPYDMELLKRHPAKAAYNMGLNLSVFPLDNSPSRPIVRHVRKGLAYFCWGLDHRARAPKTEKPLFHWVCCAASAMIGRPRLIRLTHRFLTWPKEGLMVQCMDGLYPTPYYWHREDFQETVMLPFEGLTVPAPVGYDRLLTELYGDYMQFPPPEKRVEKHEGYLDACTPYIQVIPKLLSGEIPFFTENQVLLFSERNAAS